MLDGFLGRLRRTKSEVMGGLEEQRVIEGTATIECVRDIRGDLIYIGCVPDGASTVMLWCILFSVGSLQINKLVNPVDIMHSWQLCFDTVLSLRSTCIFMCS